MSLYGVYQNFILRIEQISPTSTLERRRFVHYDPDHIMAEDSDGLQRAVVVKWEGSEEDTGITDMAQREAEHKIIVSVAYPGTWPWDRLHEIVASDRNDLIKQLRDPAKYVGIQGNETLDVGLQRRWRNNDTLEIIDGGGALLSIAFSCNVLELE